MDMFSLPEEAAPEHSPAEPGPPAAHPLLQELAALHPDELTPRQALDLLYQLQKQAAAAQEAT